MRRAVVRLIAGKELRDQVRDRRTMFLILGLPVLMYPLFLVVGYLFAQSVAGRKPVVGVVGLGELPQAAEGWPAAIDPAAAVGGGPLAAALGPRWPLPPLVRGDTIVSDGRAEAFGTSRNPITVRPVPAGDLDLLTDRQVDAVLVVEPGFVDKLTGWGRPAVRIVEREGDENSKMTARRLTAAVREWSRQVAAVRFANLGLPTDLDRPITVIDPQAAKSSERKAADELRDSLVKVLPALLAMWALTGVMYPAIDLTAGEKERGTMETLLISPATRGEVVAGKFLAVTALGVASAVWNVALLLAAVAVGQILLPDLVLVSLPGLALSVLMVVPVTMVLAAGALALGVQARSTKEGNFYMVPMFIVVVPLIYYSAAPGIELDGKTSWVPITNAMIVQQRLMAVRPDPFPWQHLPAVAVSMTACVVGALWFAARQFNREDVLFRESGPAGGGGLLRSLFGRR